MTRRAAALAGFGLVAMAGCGSVDGWARAPFTRRRHRNGARSLR
ncbi:hypothetical protein [Jiangella mangrovi]|uniref:Uncharacterized protein n=1 Tax=Jiangella mangrovi TaxID=1524084 RepID=A0A7W9GSJ9_9ACTN|nr:hypothetical protein [Jiangella mangrovi]MBB5789273.1 hypothetical protein [Jiangella mangrovi]